MTKATGCRAVGFRSRGETPQVQPDFAIGLDEIGRIRHVGRGSDQVRAPAPRVEVSRFFLGQDDLAAQGRASSLHNICVRSLTGAHCEKHRSIKSAAALFSSVPFRLPPEAGVASSEAIDHEVALFVGLVRLSV